MTFFRDNKIKQIKLDPTKKNITEINNAIISVPRFITMLRADY